MKGHEADGDLSQVYMTEILPIKNMENTPH